MGLEEGYGRPTLRCTCATPCRGRLGRAGVFRDLPVRTIIPERLDPDERVMLALGDFAVTVTNARNSARWWEEKAGFSVHVVDGPDGHAVMVAPPGERFLLHLCEGIEPVEPGNTGIAFVTDEIEQKVHRMEAEGVIFIEPLKKLSWGGSAKFSDPDGNVFWLLGAPQKFIRQQLAMRAKSPTRARAPKRRARRRAAPKR
jgi:predicted enzyme related to lactoylglutathione lyase